jgi:hypothetical protein
MTRTLRGTALFVALVAAALLALPAFAQGAEEAKIRVAHLSPDAPKVDVYVNDEPVDTLQGVPYGTVSPYLPLPAGSQNVKVYATGDTSDPLIDTDVDFREGTVYTVAAVGLVENGSLKAQVYEDDNSLPAEGEAKVRAIHAAPDVPSVDIAPQNGDDLFTNLGFPNATKYAEVPAGTYPLEARARGSGELVFTVDVALSAGTVYTAFASGLAEDGTLTVELVKDAGAGGHLRGVEPIPDSGGVSPVWLFSAAILLIVAGTSVVSRIIKFW